MYNFGFIIYADFTKVNLRPSGFDPQGLGVVLLISQKSRVKFM